MKKVISVIILYSSFASLSPGTGAQWDGAKVERLTHNSSANKMVGLYIDKNDKLFLFYSQRWWDPQVQPYRDTILAITKDKGGEWSQPDKIGNSSFDAVQYGKCLGYDTETGITHMIYLRLMSLAYDTMYYTNSEMSNWELVKIDSLSNDHNAEYESVAMGFDTLGNVHLVWNVDFDSTGSSWYRVMYANNSTGEWVKQQVSPPIWLGDMGIGPAQFTVQKNGVAHITYLGEPYCGLECEAFYITNDSLNGTDWRRDTIPRPSRPLWYHAPSFTKVDANDRVHLITAGCLVEYCGSSPGNTRYFYYHKETQDSIWQGPELILDSLSSLAQIFIDNESIPYLLEWDPFTYCWFFTDRKQGFWQEPYQVFDTTSMCNALSSIYVRSPSFVLDSEGTGHAVFTGYLRQFLGQDDSLEIYHYGPPFTSVEDASEEQREFSFELLQNHPNPFNSVTTIQYTVSSRQNRPVRTTLKVYNILGKEVRELVNTNQSTGSYSISWDGKNNVGKEVASGMYFYQLLAGDSKQTKKLVLVK